jgi:hypothetical protein
MAITKATASSVAPAAKGDLVVGSGTNDAAVLGVGTNGYTLVADSAETTGLKWAAPAAGGANWSLLNTGGTALTGAATITVSGISNKDKIMVLIDVASSASADSYFLFRLNTDTGNNYKDYNWFGRGSTTWTIGNQYQVSRGSATNGITLSNQSDAGSIMSGYVMITGAASSGKKIIHRATGVETASTQYPYQGAGGGLYDSSSAITSISLFSGVGNFDAGTVFVWVSD